MKIAFSENLILCYFSNVFCFPQRENNVTTEESQYQRRPENANSEKNSKGHITKKKDVLPKLTTGNQGIVMTRTWDRHITPVSTNCHHRIKNTICPSGLITLTSIIGLIDNHWM